MKLLTVIPELCRKGQSDGSMTVMSAGVHEAVMAGSKSLPDREAVRVQTFGKRIAVQIHPNCQRSPGMCAVNGGHTPCVTAGHGCQKRTVAALLPGPLQSSFICGGGGEAVHMGSAVDGGAVPDGDPQSGQQLHHAAGGAVLHPGGFRIVMQFPAQGSDEIGLGWHGLWRSVH